MDIMISELEGIVPIVTVLVYCIIEIFKPLLVNSKFKRLIPVFSMMLGMLLAIIAYKLSPTSFDVGVTYMTIAFSGAMSGLAATGCNQFYKQIKKYRTINDDDKSNTDDIL